MKLRTRLLVAVALIATLAGIGAAAAPSVYAVTGDPVITVTAPATVVAGDTITFDVTVTPGWVPGNPRITWRNPRTGQTLNVANSSVIPVTFDGAVYHYTFRTYVSDLGRTEVFQVETPVFANVYNSRKVYGSIGFTLVAAPVVTTTTVAPVPVP